MPLTESRPQWLSLSEAAQILGVHSSTLRGWIDDGSIQAFRTPGGHRRVQLSEVQKFLSRRASRASPDTVAAISERALVQIRSEIENRRPAREPWLRHPTKRERAHLRELGQRLFGLLIQYAGRRGHSEPIIEQARELAAEYGRSAAQEDLSASDIAQAFVFFRRAILESAFHPENSAAQIDREGMQILQRINFFMDDLLLATLEAYTRSARD